LSPRRRRGLRLLAAGIVVVVVAGGAAGYLITRDSGGDTTAQPQLQTATARRTELRQTVDAQFTIARSQSFTLKAPSAGTVTKIHLTEGKALPTLQPLSRSTARRSTASRAPRPSTATSPRATAATTSRRSRPRCAAPATILAMPTATSAARP